VKKLSLIVLCIGFCAACEADSRSSSSDGSASTGNAALDEVLTAYCETARSCCRGEGHSTGPLDRCEEYLSSGELVASLSAGKVTLREPERTACVTWLRTLPPTCVEPKDSPCRHIFEGTLGEGERCDDAAECRGTNVGAACFRVSIGDEAPGLGICRGLTKGELGSPCFNTVDEDGYRTGYSTSDANTALVVCDRRDGLFCDLVTYTCKSLVGAGDRCDYDDCPDGYYCYGTCLPKLPAGSPCESYDACSGDLRCGEDDTCTASKITDGDTCEGDVD
jgi:hypothetical protein